MISNLCQQKSVKKVKKCKKVKVVGIFFSWWSNRWRLPSLLDRRSQKSRWSLIDHEPWFGEFLRLSLGISPALSFLSEASKKKKGREEELGRFGCVGIASQGALPNFQRMVSDDRKTPTIRTGNSARHTKEGKLSGLLSFFSKKAISNVGKKDK